MGLLVQNLVMFAVAYLIAFSSGWKMTLVVTASIPLMVIAGGIQASVMTGFSSQARTPPTRNQDCRSVSAMVTACQPVHAAGRVALLQLHSRSGELYNAAPTADTPSCCAALLVFSQNVKGA